MCTPLQPLQVIHLVVWIHLSKLILNSRSLEEDSPTKSHYLFTKLSNIWSDIWWGRLGPNLYTSSTWRTLKPEAFESMSGGAYHSLCQYLHTFHSFTPSLHPLPLTFRWSWRFTLLTFIRQPEEKQPAIRSPKTRSGWISFPHVEATNLPD